MGFSIALWHFVGFLIFFFSQSSCAHPKLSHPLEDAQPDQEAARVGDILVWKMCRSFTMKGTQSQDVLSHNKGRSIAGARSISAGDPRCFTALFFLLCFFPMFQGHLGVLKTINTFLWDFQTHHRETGTMLFVLVASTVIIFDLYQPLAFPVICVFQFTCTIKQFKNV